MVVGVKSGEVIFFGFAKRDLKKDPAPNLSGVEPRVSTRPADPHKGEGLNLPRPLATYSTFRKEKDGAPG